ncbi:pseudouridine synthase [Fibrivirga algicola]|uniref:Pseudouridine synthase n=1 Tax=Fibrivirga algicola TaxID=2950420 RepID=A0ABX0QK53_9BACT|nr:pseudouridine synthase [Fibrivirga algicola]ARK12136.1 pseudouridine synthase [Fibrella sp. ES10-3-2-2]NID11028.1 pseudouridine synthase [Fibrivirga algicola]
MHYLIYKPFGMLSQFSKEGDKATLGDLSFAFERDVYPVGRLDADSEGLLLLTNDKSINHRLLDPRFAHERTYYVQVDGAITDEALQQLAEGVTITVDGKPHHTLPAIARRLNEPDLPPRNPPIRFRANIPTTWISLTLTEGKNRQVRKMTAAVGFPTLRLVRWAIGHLTAEGLAPADIRTLLESDITQLLTTNGSATARLPLRPRKRR